MADPRFFLGFGSGPYPTPDSPSPQSPSGFDPLQVFGFGSTFGAFPPQLPDARRVQYRLPLSQPGPALHPGFAIREGVDWGRVLDEEERKRRFPQYQSRKTGEPPADSPERWFPMGLSPSVSPFYSDPTKPAGKPSTGVGDKAKQSGTYPNKGQFGFFPFVDLTAPEKFLGPGTKSNFGGAVIFNDDPISWAGRVYSSASRANSGTEFTKPTIGVGVQHHGNWEAGVEGNLENRAVKARVKIPIGRTRPGR